MIFAFLKCWAEKLTFGLAEKEKVEDYDYSNCRNATDCHNCCVSLMSDRSIIIFTYEG